MYEKIREFKRAAVKSVLLVAPFNRETGERLQLSHDISTGGCHFISEKEFGVGSILTIKILIMSEVIEPTCRVAWEILREDGHYDIGVKFLIISSEELALLENHIVKHSSVLEAKVELQEEQEVQY